METNKVYNVDCYTAIKQIEDNSVDLIYTDIPYLYNNCVVGWYSELSKSVTKKRISIKDFSSGIYYSILQDFKRICKKMNCFIWCSKMQIFDILKFAVENEYNYELLVWCKTNPQPTTNNTWLPDLEYCIYIREKGVRLNDGYELKSKFYNSPINAFDKKLFDHPTIKPVELVKQHILHTTQPNDLVLDPFVGSGTTCVASKISDRKYIGFEIDENFYKIAQKRLNNETSNGQLSLLTI